MGIQLRNVRTLLWACSALGALGATLGLLPPYRDLLGVIRTPGDLMLRNAPGLVAMALHAWCAVRASSLRSTRLPVVRVCGVFDLVVGATRSEEHTSELQSRLHLV